MNARRPGSNSNVMKGQVYDAATNKEAFSKGFCPARKSTAGSAARAHHGGGKSDGAGARIGGAVVVGAGPEREGCHALARREAEAGRADARVQHAGRAARVRARGIHTAQLHSPAVCQIHLHSMEH